MKTRPGKPDRDFFWLSRKDFQFFGLAPEFAEDLP